MADREDKTAAYLIGGAVLVALVIGLIYMGSNDDMDDLGRAPNTTAAEAPATGIAE